jgi:hypothetical protein
MSCRPAITERSGRYLIALLLCIKLVLLVWNAKVYDGVSYAPQYHADRALFGGLKVSKLAYDSPLYYLPALLVPRPADVVLVERSSELARERDASKERRKRPSQAERSFRSKLLDVLRYTNVLWVGFFYVAWIGYAFPRLLRDRRAWFLASLVLLAVPGYQKLAAMSHPDNLFAAASALAVCAWLWLRQHWLAVMSAADARLETSRPDRWLVALACVVGLVGLTRPLALAYVAPLTLVAFVYAARFSGGRLLLLLRRAALVAALVGVLSASWYIVRWRQTGAVLASVHDDVTAQNEPLRRNFPYARYLRTFYPGELWDNPNSSFGEVQPGADPRLSHANSLPSLLHSETWGDHWLSFSGEKQRDGKIWAKRVSLGAALLVPLITLLLFAAWLWSFGARGRLLWQDNKASRALERLRKVWAALETELVLGAICTLGAALFLWWQMGPALLPGDNSSVKFIYVAAFFPPAIALLLSRTLEKLPALLLVAYFLALYLAAFPVAMYYPG